MFVGNFEDDKLQFPPESAAHVSTCFATSGMMQLVKPINRTEEYPWTTGIFRYVTVRFNAGRIHNARYYRCDTVLRGTVYNSTGKAEVTMDNGKWSDS